MKKHIKRILREQKPKYVDAKYVFTTDWRPSDVNEGSDYREAVFVYDEVEFRCYIDRDMRNYSDWETWLELAEKGKWYTVRILYKKNQSIYRGNQVRLHGDGIPKPNDDIDIDPKDSLFNF